MSRYTNARLSLDALKRLPLKPLEGFVLSRVDADSTEDDVALGTGLDAATVQLALDRLVELGAVRVTGGRSRMPAARMSRPPEAHLQGAEDVCAAPDVFTAEELELVHLLEARMLLANHYVLLGVALSADRRAIKDAYYELVAMVHPDRFRGRNLGVAAPRVARIFAAVEAAHEALASRDQRARNDDSWSDANEPLTSPQVTAVSSGQERAPAALPEEAPLSSGRLAASTSHASGHMLARKLGRAPSVAPPPISSSPPSSTQGPASARSEASGHAIAELRRRYEQLAPLAKAEKLKSLVSQGEAALANGRGAEALQAFRLAQSLDAHDTVVLRGLTQAEELAAPEIGKNYAYFAKRAEYAEQTTDARAFWESAATRAADDAETQGRAAAALLRLEGDASVALRCAGRAVLLEPKNAVFRALLGRAYLRQGMLRNAEREALAAAELDAMCTELIDLRRELTSRAPLE